MKYCLKTENCCLETLTKYPLSVKAFFVAESSFFFFYEMMNEIS